MAYRLRGADLESGRRPAAVRCLDVAGNPRNGPVVGFDSEALGFQSGRTAP